MVTAKTFTTKTKSFFLLLLSLSIFSCEDEEKDPAYPDLRVYLNRFEEEAKERGYDFDLSAVEPVYVDEIITTNGTSPCGRSYRNDDAGIRRIEISMSKGCNWLGKNEAEREILFFHEIGHAFLARPHEETKLCDGRPSTLMSSNISSSRFFSETEVEKRDYYISELIDRLAANEQCIDFERDWNTDPVFYRLGPSDKDWFFYSDNGNYIGKRKEVVDASGYDFLSIAASPGSHTEKTGYWFKEFVVPNIPECAKVTFKVKMNAEELKGGGAAIAIRAFEAPLNREGAETEEYLFLTTEDNPVSGKLENYIQELVIPCFSRKTNFLDIFVVMMPGTEGEVTFDDIELVVEKQ